MLKKSIEDILNAQVDKEGYSSNLYLAMASWAEVKGYNGVAKWLYAQSDEERQHMLKVIEYINERGGQAIIPEFKKPPVDYKNIKELFDAVLSHEQYITASINDIVGLTLDEKDFNTHSWVQWFVTEQNEEESSVQEIIDKLVLVGDKNMYMFDRDIMSMREDSASEG